MEKTTAYILHCTERSFRLCQFWNWLSTPAPGSAPCPTAATRRPSPPSGPSTRTLPGYAPTPLVPLPALAQTLGVKGIYLKDESKRFGLNAFKALGASYAIHKLFGDHPQGRPLTVTATDGNHGKGMAWSTHLLGGHAVVFMPAGTVDSRVEAIPGHRGHRGHGHP